MKKILTALFLTIHFVSFGQSISNQGSLSPNSINQFTGGIKPIVSLQPPQHFNLWSAPKYNNGCITFDSGNSWKLFYYDGARQRLIADTGYVDSLFRTAVTGVTQATLNDSCNVLRGLISSGGVSLLQMNDSLALYLKSTLAASTYATITALNATYAQTHIDTHDSLNNITAGYAINVTANSHIISADSAYLATRLRLQKVVDSLSAIIATKGTVTSIATNTGTGITGGTITGSGALANDTTILATRKWRDKLADSLNALIALKQNTINLTTTGNSGAATFVSNTLNIPTPTAAGLGALTAESDPIATAKTINLTAGSGVGITGTSSQTIGGNPTYTITATGSGGTVTTVTANALSPLFTSTTATNTTTPVISYSLSNAAAHSYFGNNTGSSAAPAYHIIDYSELANTPASWTLTVNGTSMVPATSYTITAATLTTPRSIYGNNFDGSAALGQVIASLYGGTGNGFTKFSGPATNEKTFTLPNASATILTDNTAVTVGQGGTGVGTLTAHNLLVGNGTGNMLFLAPSTSGNLNLSNGTDWLSVAMSGDLTINSSGVTAIKSSVALAGSPTTTTQSANDNSTKIATTAYVDQYIPNYSTATTTATLTPTAAITDRRTPVYNALTAQAAALTIANPSGTFADMQVIELRLYDNGTSRAITYGTNYNGGNGTLPAATTTGKDIYIEFQYNARSTKYDCVAGCGATTW